MPARDDCPCSSGRKFRACCAPFHRGEREPPDAEVLMRSRYAAFASKEADYLWRTLHPDHDDRRRPKVDVLREIRAAASAHRYPGLTILDRGTPDDGGVARVLFLARVFASGKERSFVELSDFVHDGEGWRYLCGRAMPVSSLRGDPAALDIAAFSRLG